MTHSPARCHLSSAKPSAPPRPRSPSSRDTVIDRFAHPERTLGRSHFNNEAGSSSCSLSQIANRAHSLIESGFAPDRSERPNVAVRCIVA